jgi:hypothetical protein
LACLKHAGLWSGDPACLGMPGLTGLEGAVQQNGDHACVGPGLGRIRGTCLRSEYCAGVYRPWGHGPAERRSCMFVSPAQPALGAWPPKQRPWGAGGRGPAKQSSCKAVQALGGMAWQRSCRAVQAWWVGGLAVDHKCLWILGLKGSSHRYPAVLRGGSLG